jgi:hypothetical protein
VEALRSALDDARFDTLEDTYPHPGTCNDCFLETVTYRGRSVAVENGLAPASLQEALGLIGVIATGG